MATVPQDFDEARRRMGDTAVRAAVADAKPLTAVTALTISATPYRFCDPKTLPLRPWVYGRQLLRGSLSLVVAPGATGKTALMVGTSLALATGRDFLDKRVWDGPKRVWLWNLEDSMDELTRSISAACLHWRVSEQDLGGRLFVDSGLDGAELKIAIEDRDGFRIARPVVDALTAELQARKIDVLIVDPFVSSHGCSENDNGAIDAIAKQWARIGVQANCSIVLVHHTGKLAGGEATAEKARGASALTGCARSVIALNKMTPQEGVGFGIEGNEHRSFFRAYDDKNNRAPPAEKSDWFRLISVHLGNGPDGEFGDSLPVAVPWSPPDAFDGVRLEHLLQVQAMVGRGDYRKDPQAADWVGNVVAEVLGVDAESETGKARLKKLIAKWVQNGVLVAEQRQDPATRKMRAFVAVGRPAVEEDATP